MSWRSRFLPNQQDLPRSAGSAAIEECVAGRPSKSGANVIADNPIRKPEEDLLGRVRSARSFADQVLSLDASEGIVVGVLGPWGSGKTSFVNLARGYLREAGVVVLDFNPWMFSGTEQLVNSFFLEFSAQLRIRPELAEIGEHLDAYSEIFSDLGWLPFVGPWIDRGRMATKKLATILRRSHTKEGIGVRRTKVEKALATLDQPIIVSIDDIDRLTSSEIRDVFKLVRLTANFPNVIYIVAFDRARVEKALEEQGIPGRDYLEKILQIGVDLPAVPSHVLTTQILGAINKALEGVDSSGPFDESVWPDVFMEVIRPLLRNMRDVRRYVAAIHGTIQDLGDQVALVDVLALEALRVFLPDVSCRLHESVEGLTATPSDNYGDPSKSLVLKAKIDGLIAAAGDRGEVIRSLILRLFPGAGRHIGAYGGDSKNRWLLGRRVAHEEILRNYLERVVGEGLQAFTDAERAWMHMADRGAFDSYLRSLDPARLEDVISSLEAYEHQFAPIHVVSGSIVLLNILPDLPARERAMFQLDTRFIVGRVVYRLLRSLGNPDTTEAAVREILPQLTRLSSKEQLITIVGHREKAGHQLVSEPAARRFEEDWRAEVFSAPVDSLVKERELLWILRLARQDADSTEEQPEIADSTQVTLALLRSALSEVKSQAVGTRAVHRSPRLAWEELIELYGSEEILCERIKSLKTEEVGGIDDLLELVAKYLSGWRPTHFDQG